MSEIEIFTRDWESAERSRQARLMEELKREFRVEPKSAPVEGAMAVPPLGDVPYSLRLPPAVPRQPSYSRYPGRGEERSRHEIKE